MKYREFKSYIDKDLISTVRVVPIPLTKGWCIDVLIKDVMSVGSHTDTLESDRSTDSQRKVRRFASIDSAARYLARLGIGSFLVEMDDAISFVHADAVPDPKATATAAEVAEPEEAVDHISVPASSTVN